MLCRPEDGFDIGEGREDAVGRFVEDLGPSGVIPMSQSRDMGHPILQSFEGGAALAFFGGKESVEGEGFARCAFSGRRVTHKPARDQRADGGVRAGDGEDGDARRDGCRRNLAAGVGDAGGSRVADHGDARAGLERAGKFGGAAGLVVHVVADRGRANGEVVEQFLGLARVLAGNFVYRSQHAQRAQGDVLEVADGSGHEVKAGSERLGILAFFVRVHPQLPVVNFCEALPRMTSGAKAPVILRRLRHG